MLCFRNLVVFKFDGHSLANEWLLHANANSCTNPVTFNYTISTTINLSHAMPTVVCKQYQNSNVPESQSSGRHLNTLSVVRVLGTNNTHHWFMDFNSPFNSTTTLLMPLLRRRCPMQSIGRYASFRTLATVNLRVRNATKQKMPKNDIFVSRVGVLACMHAGGSPVFDQLLNETAAEPQQRVCNTTCGLCWEIRFERRRIPMP